MDLAREGQKPEVMMIACCDSRSAPETIFNSHPGEMFVVRNIANLVPPYEPDGHFHATSAALEFGVQVLGVKHIVVMGHGQCGGIKAALDPDVEPLSPGDFVGKWIELLKPAANSMAEKEWKSAQERQTALEHVSVRNSIENLRSFPWISSLEGQNKLGLHGAWLDISRAELWTMDSQTGDFDKVKT